MIQVKNKLRVLDQDDGGAVMLTEQKAEASVILTEPKAEVSS